jgi:hypothetical protein
MSSKIVLRFEQLVTSQKDVNENGEIEWCKNYKHG